MKKIFKKCLFKPTKFLDSRKQGSVLELEKEFKGITDGNIVYFTDKNESEWTFWINETCIVTKIFE